jgi:predicted ArsR family transcriptional regulator
MQYNADRQATNQKATVQDAAKILGITPEAVRQRLKRGTLAKEKASDGTVYVLLDADQDRHNRVWTNDTTGDLAFMQAHLDSLQDQIEHLRGELEIRNDDLRRKDTIIAQMNQTLAAMAQRIPELEPTRENPSERQESTESTDKAAERVKSPPPDEPREGTTLKQYQR